MDVDGLARRLPHIGQRKLTVCLNCHDTAANSQGQGTRYGIVPRLYKFGSVWDRDLASDRDHAIVQLRVSYNVASCAFICAL